jgi:hypothetical protein
MVAQEKHVDAYGQMFFYGSQVVIGKYFKQQVGVHTHMSNVTKVKLTSIPI